MKYKTILALSLATMLSIGVTITGCGNKKDNSNNNSTSNIEKGVDKVGDAAKNGGEAVKDGIENAGDKIRYTAINLKDDITKAGRNLKDSSESKKNYFSDATETDYSSEDGSLVRVYEFNNSSDADAALKKISSDGLTIDGNSVYTKKPYYYRKGNTIIIYEGVNDAYINDFNTLYGNPII